MRRRHWADAPDAHHRSGERRQGGRRAGALPGRARRATRCSWCRPRPTPSTTSASCRPRGSWSAPRSSTFPRLVRELARRAGVRARVARARVARERVVRAAVGRRPTCTRSPRSAAAPGFAGAPPRRCSPSSAARWSARRGSRARCATGRPAETAPPHAGELARAVLGLPPPARARSARVDADGLARAALDALRERPAAWRGRPVFLYGFDDLTPLAARRGRDARRAHAPTSPSRSRYEPGRAAFAGRAATVELLKPLAERHELLEDRSEHYAPAARAALHHLERGLFEPGRRASRARTARCGCWRPAASAPRPSWSPPRCSSCWATACCRRTSRCSSAAARRRVLAQVLEALRRPGQPATAGRRSRTRGSAPACWRSPARRSPAARAADLLTWLRTPGRLADPDAAPTRSRLTSAAPRSRPRAEARARPRRGAATLDALADAAATSRRRSSTRCVAEARRDLDRAAPPRGRRARARRRGRRARRRERCAPPPPSCARSRRADAGAGRHAARSCSRRSARVRGARAGRSRARVLLADPLAIRARRFRAVFVCGLQEGEFPRRPSPSRSSTTARGSRSRVPAASCCRRTRTSSPRERYLFYAAVSRPEEVLFLSFRVVRRGGRPGAAVAVPRRRARAVHRRAVGASRPAAARRGHLAARRGADAARAAPRAARPPRSTAEPPPLGAPVHASPCWPPSPRARPRRRAGWRRSRAAACAGSSSSCCARARRARPGADAPRLARPRGARAHAAAPAGPHWPPAHPLAAGGARRARAPRSASCARQRAGHARRGRRSRARGRPRRYLRHEAESGAGLEPR